MIHPRLKTSMAVLLGGLAAEAIRAFTQNARHILRRISPAPGQLLPVLEGYEVLQKGDKRQNEANKAGPLLGQGSYGQVFAGEARNSCV